MTTKAQYEDLIRRQTEALQSQLMRIEQLEAEITRLNAVIHDEGNALQVLRKVYTDANAPLSAVLKAAAVCAPFEAPRMPTASVSFDVSALAARLAAARRGELEVIAEPGDEADTGDAGDAV